MRGMPRATSARQAAMVAVLGALCLPMGWARDQHPKPSGRSAPVPQRREYFPRREAPRGQDRGRGVQPLRPSLPPGRPSSVPFRPQPAPTHPQLPNGAPYGQPQGGRQPLYPAQGIVRPALPGPSSINAPPGHLQSWLNEHRSVPVQNQEQLLRSDPSFKRLPPVEQQRLVRQLQDVSHLSEQARQRRLERAEALERLSPEERMGVNRSAREWTTLPPDRQGVMKNAFRDLRSVPPDQRGIVLNSARYQQQFSPQERGILSDLLRAEPYEAPRQ